MKEDEGKKKNRKKGKGIERKQNKELPHSFFSVLIPMEQKLTNVSTKR